MREGGCGANGVGARLTHGQFTADCLVSAGPLIEFGPVSDGEVYFALVPHRNETTSRSRSARGQLASNLAG
jgi:hypothetical protein